LAGGPAGLSAALSLARYDRRVAVFDTDQGRSSWPQINHNYLGFPGGVAARKLRALGRQQLGAYPQVALWDQQIEGLEHANEAFIAHGPAGRWQGRAVILCTGVADHYACFAGWEACVGRSLFWCLGPVKKQFPVFDTTAFQAVILECTMPHLSTSARTGAAHDVIACHCLSMSPLSTGN
jgi:thioredoxin reductase